MRSSWLGHSPFSPWGEVKSGGRLDPLGAFGPLVRGFVRRRMADRQAAANDRLAILAQQFERAAERPDALVHSRQPPAEYLARQKPDAVVGDIDRHLPVIDRRLDVDLTGVGVPKNVGHAFLDHPINRLGEWAVDVIELRIDAS